MDLNMAADLARRTIREHGLAEKGWRFEWDNASLRFGACSYSTKTIKMSRKLTALNPMSEVLDCILHEVAHALTPGHKHDAVWAATHRKIGGNGKRTHSAAVPALRYRAKCPGCGLVIDKAKRPTNNHWHKGCVSDGVPKEYLRWVDTKTGETLPLLTDDEIRAKRATRRVARRRRIVVGF